MKTEKSADETSSYKSGVKCSCNDKWEYRKVGQVYAVFERSIWYLSMTTESKNKYFLLEIKLKIFLFKDNNFPVNSTCSVCLRARSESIREIQSSIQVKRSSIKINLPEP